MGADFERFAGRKRVPARVCGMLYKATVQSVLLFGSETWALTLSTIKRLEGFHVRAAQRMTGKMLPRESMPVLISKCDVYT